VLSLPMFPELSPAQQRRVVTEVLLSKGVARDDRSARQLQATR
jgi:hypothetical protein